MQKAVAVMEWWSNGVMKEFIQVESTTLAFPTLQYSKTARNLFGQSHARLTWI